MCTAKNYLSALEKEMELRLNGYQTSLLEAEYIGEKDGFHKYKLLDSKLTNSKYEDILNTFRSNFKKGFGCYQVSGYEIPKAKLKPENWLEIYRLDKEKVWNEELERQEICECIWLKKRIKECHFLCVPPSTIQIAAEISVLEHISGVSATLSTQVRHEVENFEKKFSIPKKIPTTLSNLLQTENLELPTFQLSDLVENDYVVLKDNERPGNEEQRQFVKNALSTPDFTIKVGPPGSGKTTSIVELLIQLVKKGKRVLLVASTNVAIDNILEKLKDHLDLVSVKRHGNDDNVNVSIEAKKFIAGKNFGKTEAANLKCRLKSNFDGSSEETNKFFSENFEYKENELLYEILEENAPIVAGTTFGVALPEMRKLASKGESEPPFDYLILDEASKTTIQEFLVPAVLCKHWIIVGDTKQLSPYVSDADLAENAQICYPEDDSKMREYTVASDVLLVSSGNASRQTVLLVEKESDYDTYLYRKYSKEKKILFADADKLEDREILPYASIIVGSLESFQANDDLISPRITTVRVARDKESGIAYHSEEMQKWVSIARYNREKLFNRFDENEPKEWHDEISWRLIRMFEQRDNIVNADHSALERLKRDIASLIPKEDKEVCEKKLKIFEQIYLPSCMELFLKGYGAFKDLALFRGFPKEQLDERCIQLSFQHRSHSEIAEMASQEFYEGNAMRSEHMRNKREWKYSRFKKHVHWENINGFCDSKNRNKKELKWIEQELMKFREFAKSNPKVANEGKWSVAVLSFYKEQAEELKKCCQRIFKDSDKVITYSAGSVDSFQGHEADIVFLSYSNQNPTCFIGAPNRLNVAITRARYMMVHVGNWNAMSKAEGALGRLAQNIKNKTTKN